MSDYVTNILRFKGKPFAKDIPLFVYHSGSDADFYQIGHTVRNLRRIGPNKALPIFQSGTDIMSIQPLEDDDHKWLEPFSCEEKKVNASTESDRRLIRQLISESVAVKLRNKPEEKWIIGQISTEVYEVKRKDELEQFGPIAVYPGYRFSALVRANGEAGLVLNPKYRLHSVYNLRTLYQRGDKLLRDIFLEIPLPDQDRRANVVDLCPLEDCPEKDDPLSACRLAGIGNNARLVGIQEKKPSEILVPDRNSGADIDLIEYHNTDDVCIRREDFIDNTSPVAEVRYRGSKRYSIPLERLRLTPTFDILNDPDRAAVMKRVRPDPGIRLKRTRAYFGDLGDISLGNFFDLEQDSLEVKWSSRSSEIYNVSYEVGGNQSGEYPEFLIKRHGPYDLDNDEFRTANIAVVHSESRVPDEVNMIREVLASNHSNVASMNQYLRMKCKIVKIINLNSSNFDETISVLSDLNKRMSNFLTIIIFGKRGDKKVLEQLTDTLIIRQIPKQGINQQEMRSMFEDRKRGYFFNIFLGIYAKLGGQPWVLQGANSDFDKVVGFSSRYDDDNLTISLCQYSFSGEFLTGSCRRLPRDTTPDEFRNILEKSLSEKSLLLKTGALLSSEAETIKVAKEEVEFKVVEIIGSFPIRIYGTDESSRKMPELGRGVWLSDRDVALVTTTVPPHRGTPNPLHIRNVTLHDHEFDKFIPLAFSLTQCHIGYRGRMIRYPIPCHASSKALAGFVQLGIDQLDFERPWFI